MKERTNKRMETQPCDLISRQDAIDILAYFDEQNPLGHTPQQLIMTLPSAQPMRKKGKWELHTYMPHHKYCSCCGSDSPYNKAWEYCPNCGADMRGEQDV